LPSASAFCLRKDSPMAAKPIPDGYHSVTPYLIVRNAARALDYYKQAFGATELVRMNAPEGKIGHAEVRIGDSVVMLADEFPGWGAKSPEAYGGSPVHLMIYVEDCDAVFNRALAAGGKEIRPLKDQFYGDRSGTLDDPYGHQWTIATHKEDLSPEEMQQRSEAAMKEMGA
jgi:PhnB protein